VASQLSLVISGNPAVNSLQHPLISVVLPVFNGERHIAQALNSILDQTFQDFELIVINDGSTDSTLEILQNFARKDKRIRIVSRENKGLVASLNEGIDLAGGTWLARMDADDVAYPKRFEWQLACLEQTAADICGGGVSRFGSSDRRVFKPRADDEAIKMQMLFSCPFAHPTVMMRTVMARQLQYDPAWGKAEDYDLWERAARAGWKMANVPDVLLAYRVHGNQTSAVSSIRQRELASLIMRRRWKHVYETWGVEWQAVEELLKLFGWEASKVDMDAVDAVLMKLLDHSQGEAREVVLDQVTQSYLRAAADCPRVIARWCKFFPARSQRKMLPIKAQLFLLRAFRIRLRQTGSYSALRSFYRAVVR
jgi:glycosyltransferase involved in cell wall biosynthesis